MEQNLLTSDGVIFFACNIVKCTQLSAKTRILELQI